METHAILGKAEVDSSILSGGTTISPYTVRRSDPLGGLCGLAAFARSGMNACGTPRRGWEIRGSFVREAFQ